MRNVLLSIILAVLLASCGGGGPAGIIPVDDVDPSGHWTAVGVGAWTAGEWDIVADGNGWLMDFPTSDAQDFDLTVDGNAFQASGSRTDLLGIARYDNLFTGTIDGDTMTGTWTGTETRLDNGDITVETTEFTATR